MMPKGLGLYIHVPFCKSKCRYCDFNSQAGKNELIEPYFKDLAADMAGCRGKLEGREISSVFIGGGTPSYVEAAYIAGVLEEARELYSFAGDAEITLEANPDTLNREKLRMYRKAGINRLSIGLQAWQNRLLTLLGRTHGHEVFEKSYRTAREEGFSNINVDLIFGIPGQTFEDWDETLKEVVRLGPEHISCYSLSIEEGTWLWEEVRKGEIRPVDDQLDRRMYHHARELLTDSGFFHYEISNFARKGCQCRHNIRYWKAGEYVGIGTGAHSCLEGKRFCSIERLEDYIEAVLSGRNYKKLLETLDEKEKMSEFMILGLRLIEGVSFAEFESVFKKSLFDLFGHRIEELLNRGLVELEGGRIKLTRLGLDMGNQVFMEFL